MVISYKGDDQSENSFCYEEIINLNIQESRNVTLKEQWNFLQISYIILPIGNNLKSSNDSIIINSNYM